MMALNKQRSNRYDRINTDWWIDDWSATVSNKNNLKSIDPSPEYASSIVLKPGVDPIEMVKTKYFLSESLKISKGIEGTMIIGPSASSTVSELHAILLNIQPFGWIYIPGGRKK